MSKQSVVLGILMLSITLAAYGQVVLIGGDEDGPQFSLTGELTGMFTAGIEEDDQVITPSGPPGIFDGEKVLKNGYYTSLNFGILFSPVSTIDLYVKLLARSRPGSSYIPLQSADSGAESFAVSVDSAWGRVNAVKGLGMDVPLDVWLKAGKFDTAPSHFLKVSRYGAEAVMGNLRTANKYALQIEAAYPLSWADAVSASFTTAPKLNEELEKLYLSDGSQGGNGTPVTQGDINDKYIIPIHTALKLYNLSLPVGDLSAEILYALNAEHIFSGQNFGLDLGLNIPVAENFSIPVGLGVAYYEMNIDTIAGTALDKNSQKDSLYKYVSSSNPKALDNDADTTGFRQTLRLGVGAGARYDTEGLAAELNLGFAYSQIAHIYRNTLSLASLSADLRATYLNRYFIGGGIVLGTLGEAEWKTADENISRDGYRHIFTPEQNMGFEVYGGLQFNKARLVVGYNCNKGLAMNYSIESVGDAQIAYKQKDTTIPDGLFESGGVFTKLVISW
jgi:hypothetical protein